MIIRDPCFTQGGGGLSILVDRDKPIIFHPPLYKFDMLPKKLDRVITY